MQCCYFPVTSVIKFFLNEGQVYAHKLLKRPMGDVKIYMRYM